MAVFAHYLDAPPQGASTGGGTTTFNAGDEKVILSEIMRLWNSVPIGSGRPLWSRPGIVPSLSLYPGFGFQYTDYEILKPPTWSVPGAQNPFARNYVWIELPSQSNENWSIRLRYISVNLQDFTDYSIILYGEALIYGTSYTHNDHSIEIQNNSSLSASGGWDEWYLIEMPHISSHLPSGYDWTQGYLYEMAIAIAGTDVVYELNRTPVDGYSDVSPYHDPLTLTVSGTISPGAIRIIENGELPNQDYLAYMLNISLAWIRQDGGVYHISNKLYFGDTATNFSDNLKVVFYQEEMDSRIDTFNSLYSYFENSDVLCNMINEYAINTYNNYPRICSWACNEEKSVGDYVWLPSYHYQPIQIVEKYYDMRQPFLWHYKGRSA